MLHHFVDVFVRGGDLVKQDFRGHCQVNEVTATLGVASARKRQAAAAAFHVTNARERRSR